MVFDYNGYYKRFLSGTNLHFPKLFWNTFYSTISFYCDYGKVIERDYKFADCEYVKLTKDLILISVNDLFAKFFELVQGDSLLNLKQHLIEVLKEYFGNVIDLSQQDIVISLSKCKQIEHGYSIEGFELMESLGELFRVCWVKAEISRYFKRMEEI